MLLVLKSTTLNYLQGTNPFPGWVTIRKAKISSSTSTESFIFANCGTLLKSDNNNPNLTNIVIISCQGMLNMKSHLFKVLTSNKSKKVK